jgi:RNA polymerase sigma factor (sigma-70 family)
VTTIRESNYTDKDLVDKVLGGNTGAFGLIVKNTERLVAQIVFKMIPAPEDRKDLAQDIFLKAYRSLSSFRFDSKLSTWIARISYNTCLDHLKKKKLVLQNDFFPDEEQVEVHTDTGALQLFENGNDPVRNKELAAILQKEIKRLPPVYQTLIVLYHNEECSYEEIEEITGMPMGTVKNYLFRARRELKNSLLHQYKKEEL